MNKKTERLTKKGYWNSTHDNMKSNLEKSHQYQEKLKSSLEKMLGKKIFSYIIEKYKDYLFWQICRQYLPKREGLKILEVGSAPGNRLVKFHQMFGYIPYGVEYSEEGVELNRKIFLLRNINPNNVIYTDFFSYKFQEEYKNYFDIVISLGFIEHFSDVKDVIRKHINLLTKGGIVVIAIPNIRGINYLLTLLFNRSLIPMHNLEIMEKKTFSKLFDDMDLSILYLNYYGTFNFGLFNTKKNSPLRPILKVCKYLQLLLNPIFRLIFNEKSIENEFFSPYLICIGKKL